MLKIDMEYRKGILFVRLNGVLNRLTTYKINNYLVPVILKHNIKYLIYNFENLTSIDDDGIDALLNTKDAIHINKGNIYLCQISKLLVKKIRKLKIKMTASENAACHLLEA